MDEAIEKFVNAQKGRGLFLLDMPTGAGKTFNSIKFIDSHLKGNFNIFYLTPLTKNVDDVYNDCLNNLDDSLKETFASQALRIKANDDSVIENLEKVAQQIDSSTEIHNTFFKMSSYYPLLNHVRQYNSLKSQGSSANTTEIIKTAEEQIRDLFEPDFRRDIENFLKRAAKTSGERYKLIRTKYPFLIDLYPSIESSNKHIFFMTMDKFY
jgi:hypothetical protein